MVLTHGTNTKQRGSVSFTPGFERYTENTPFGCQHSGKCVSLPDDASFLPFLPFFFSPSLSFSLPSFPLSFPSFHHFSLFPFPSFLLPFPSFSIHHVQTRSPQTFTLLPEAFRLKEEADWVGRAHRQSEALVEHGPQGIFSKPAPAQDGPSVPDPPARTLGFVELCSTE